MLDMTTDEIRAILTRSRLSMRAFAKEIGEDEKTLRLWLKGKRRPSPTQCEALISFDTQLVDGLETAARNTNTTLIPIVSEADKAASVELFAGQYFRLSEHLWIVGMTSSGKTTWALLVVQKFPRFVILDFNRDIAIPGVPMNATVDQSAPRQIIRVVAPSVKGEHAAWCAAITAAVAMGDLVLFFDELAPLTTSVNAPDALYQALTYGRHRNVSVIVVTHRPVAIPRIIPTQTHHHCYFQLDDEDAKNASGLTCIAATLIPDRPWMIGYYNKKTRFSDSFDLDDARRVREAEAARLAAAEQQREAEAQHSYGYALDKQPQPLQVQARVESVSMSADGEERHLLSPTQITKVRQAGYKEGVRDEKKREKAAHNQKLLSAQAGSTVKRTTTKKGNSRTNATESNSRPTSREEEITESALRNLDAMMDSLAARPKQTWNSPAPANGQAVQPSSPALLSADSPDSGLEYYPEDATGRPLQTTTQIEQPSSQPSRRPRFFGRREPDARAAWPFPEIDPESLEGIRLRIGNRIPGWELG